MELYGWEPYKEWFTEIGCTDFRNWWQVIVGGVGVPLWKLPPENSENYELQQIQHMSSYPKTIISLVNDVNYTKPDKSGIYVCQEDIDENVDVFLCHECGRCFSTRKKLTDHTMKSHKLSICNICSKEFSSKQNLERHRVNKHVENRAALECMYCSKSFQRKYHLERHINEVHYKNKRQIKCKSIEDKTRIKMNKRMGGFCNICQLNFSRYNSYKKTPGEISYC